MTVRPATVADADAIAAVHVRSWQVAYRGLMDDALLDGLSISDRAVTWRQMIERTPPAPDQPDHILVAERDGAIVGWCTVSVPARDLDAAAHVGEIGGLYVSPDAWGSGAGAALMLAARELVAGAGLTEITLWVLDGNDRALRFYRQFGFAEDGPRKLHRRSGRDELRMRLTLPAG